MELDSRFMGLGFCFMGLDFCFMGLDSSSNPLSPRAFLAPPDFPRLSQSLPEGRVWVRVPGRGRSEASSRGRPPTLDHDVRPRGRSPAGRTPTFRLSPEAFPHAKAGGGGCAPRGVVASSVFEAGSRPGRVVLHGVRFGSLTLCFCGTCRTFCRAIVARFIR